MSRPQKALTAHTLGLFEEMFLRGDDLHDMATGLFLYAERVKGMMLDMSMRAKDTRRKNRLQRLKARGTHQSTSFQKGPPSEAIADRDRRYHAERTIGAELMGDPRPGQSALDKMRESA